MARRLKVFVHVHDEETGQSTAYGPDDKIPAAVAKKITNPDVWEDDEPVEVGTNDPGNSGTPSEEEAAKLAADAAAAAAVAGTPPATTPAVETPDGAGSDPGNSGPVDEQPPPRNGAGSGAEEWRKYAGRQGVAVPDDASRDDVVEALKAEGKPTERQS